MAAPIAALPGPRRDQRLRVDLSVVPNQPEGDALNQTEIHVRFIATKGELAATLLTALLELSGRANRERREERDHEELLHLRAEAMNRGAAPGPIGRNFGAVPAAAPPPNNVRFDRVRDGIVRCSTCHEEVPDAEAVAHAQTHAPQVINMHEVPEPPPAGPPAPDLAAIVEAAAGVAGRVEQGGGP